MSTIAEKAKAEGDAAEAEFPDEETAEPTEPDEGDEEAEEETQPEPEPEPSGRKVKSPQEKFQTAFAAFVKKAADCFEIPPAEVAIAPHPGVVGIMLPGFAEPRTHENFTTCVTCNGRGKVLTGAVTGDPAKDEHVCPDTRCKGNGFWQKASAQTAAPQTGPLAQPPVAAGGDEFAEAPTWMGDPTLTPGQ